MLYLKMHLQVGTFDTRSKLDPECKPATILVCSDGIHLLTHKCLMQFAIL